MPYDIRYYAGIWNFFMGIPIKMSWGYYAGLRFQKTGHPVTICSIVERKVGVYKEIVEGDNNL